MNPANGGPAYFKMIHQMAQDVKRDPKTDCCVMPMCSWCGKMISGTPQRCSKCKAMVYCSKKCFQSDWTTPKVPRHPTHKALCGSNARHMLRLPTIRKTLLQFPWGRLETDDSFSPDLAKALLGVLGGSGYGYWSTRGGSNPHVATGDVADAATEAQRRRFGISGANTSGFLDGEQLLATDFLSDDDAWKLSSELIPRLTFSAEHKAPAVPTAGSVVDWDSWYSWRGIPKASPAALLMHFPLSVFWLLTHVLGVVDLQSKDKRELTVHVIGVEKELNFVPVFAELALLLPNTDLKLVFYGQAVCDLCQTAKKTRPNSLAAKPFSKSPIYTYTAPRAFNSSISIYLHSRSGTWSPMDDLSHLFEQTDTAPDALLALNAGLTTYAAWQPVIAWAHMSDVPFATTEYAEQSAEMQREGIRAIVQHAMGMPVHPLQRENLRRQREYEIGLNPFHMPGQRQIAQSRLPNLYNGFTVLVVRRDQAIAPPSKRVQPSTPAAATPKAAPTQTQHGSIVELEDQDEPAGAEGSSMWGGVAKHVAHAILLSFAATLAHQAYQAAQRITRAVSTRADVLDAPDTTSLVWDVGREVGWQILVWALVWYTWRWIARWQ